MNLKNSGKDERIVAILGRDKKQVASVELYYRNAEYSRVYSFSDAADLTKFASDHRDDLETIAILKQQNNLGWQPIAKSVRSQVDTPVILFIDMNENLTENEQKFLETLPNGSWLRTPLEYRAEKMERSTVGRGDDLLEKLQQVKDLYKKHLFTSAKKVHSGLLETYNASVSGPSFMDEVEAGILEVERILSSELSGFNHNFEVMEYYIETDNEKDFKETFDRLFKIYSEADDSYWLGQLGELCLSLGLEVYVKKIVGCMTNSDNNDFKWRAKLLEARDYIMKNELTLANDCISDAAHFAGGGKAEIFNLLGIVKRRQGQIVEAINCFENAIKLSDADHRLYFNIALCYNAVNKPDEAISGLRMALGLFPRYARAKNLLIRISQQ